MSTLPPPEVKLFGSETVEKKVYTIVENLSEYIPVPNDRNRLGFCLYKYMIGEGDAPEILVKSTKIQIEKISAEELAKKLEEALAKTK